MATGYIILWSVLSGVLIGWVFFERPQWVKDAFGWLKAKIVGP